MEKDFQNAAVLLKEQPRQALVFGDFEFCTIKKGGYVVLDMGCEIHGGADITFEKKIRVVDTRTTDVNLGKYDEKLDELASSHETRKMRQMTTQQEILCSEQKVR